MCGFIFDLLILELLGSQSTHLLFDVYLMQSCTCFVIIELSHPNAPAWNLPSRSVSMGTWYDQVDVDLDHSSPNANTSNISEKLYTRAFKNIDDCVYMRQFNSDIERANALQRLLIHVEDLIRDIRVVEGKGLLLNGLFLT